MTDALQRFYADEHDEAERLTATAHGRLEAMRTRELLAAHLPEPPASVLDVGGGPGTHARWLADRDYDVTLVDIVADHVTAARAAGLHALVGDARELDQADQSLDVVLLLGPLYHLDAGGRADALREAARVLRPGGLLAAAAITRWASLFDVAIGRAGAPWEQDVRDRLARTIDTGEHDPSIGFTTAWFHTPGELATEVGAAGFDAVEIVAVEGPLGHVADLLGDVPDIVERAATVARMTQAVPDLAGASPHLVAFGRRPA